MICEYTDINGDLIARWERAIITDKNATDLAAAMRDEYGNPPTIIKLNGVVL